MSEFTHDVGSANDDDALAAVAAARRAAADRLVTPWWYHPALGALLALYAVALSTRDIWIMLGGIVVFAAGIGVLVASYRRLTGMWISGYSSGSASRWAVAVAVISAIGAVSIMMLGWYTDVADLWIWTIAAAMAVMVVVLGRRYDVALRADLRSER